MGERHTMCSTLEGERHAMCSTLEGERDSRTYSKYLEGVALRVKDLQCAKV
jgi:hypothetical protein